MSKNLKKRIITSIILLSLLIIFNFSKFFMVGVFMVGLLICIEFSELLSKLVGPGLLKHHRNNSYPEKLNFKYLSLQILIIFYVLIVFGGTSFELHGKSGSPTFFIFILSICFFSDIGGYIIGKLIGGKKLTIISPNKTISGSIGSFLFSIFPLLLFYNYNQYEYFFSTNNLLFCLIISLVCQLGDLFISYLKRKAKIKDTGFILPGHGGLLDRVDGIIFAVPFAYLFVELI
jgi:phosphatidate cytidylyltransferase|tara:strand:+ start:148 stop:843 length:696 start_codon:yes stop_codon:yes gene_type:complete